MNTAPELTQAERRQRDAAIWREYWSHLTPEARAERTRRTLADVARQEGAQEAMDAWQAAAWRAAASSPFHEAMRRIEEIRLAIRAAGATGEALPEYPPAPEHTNGSGFDSGRCFPLGDADDSPEFAPLETRPDYQFAARVVEESLNTLAEQTGICDEPARVDRRER